MNALLAELFKDLETRQESQDEYSQQAREVKLDMRYQGQEYTLTVAMESEQGQLTSPLEHVRNAFARAYERTFSSTMDDAVEIVSVRAGLRTPLPHLKLMHRPTADQEQAVTLAAYSFAQTKRLRFRILERSSLLPDKPISGPAIINEATATTYLDAGFKAQLDPSGALFITPEEP